MTYKGSNWTRGELGHAPPDPSTITIDCAEPTCDKTTTADNLPGKWQADNNPNHVILCPTCKTHTPGKEQTPLEVRKKTNEKITEWSQ
jgi:hypothetical protein